MEKQRTPNPPHRGSTPLAPAGRALLDWENARRQAVSLWVITQAGKGEERSMVQGGESCHGLSGIK